MSIWLLASLAWGGPTGTLLPTAGPPELTELWRESAREEGLGKSDAELACRTLAEDVLLCFRVEEGKRRRWVTQGDLVDWGLSLPQVEAKAREALTKNPLRRQQVHGGSRHYFVVDSLPGRESLILLHPEWLVEVGRNPVIAIPARDAVLAWNLGDDELDKIMAVGIRKLHETSDVPVSRKIMAWDGAAWVVRGEVADAAPSTE